MSAAGDWRARAHAPGASGPQALASRDVPLVTPLLGAALVLVLLTLLTANPWLLLFACAAGGLVVVAFVRRPRLEGLRYCLAVPGPAVVGQRTTHRLHVHNRGSRPSPLARLTIRTAGLTDAVLVVEPIPPGGVAALDLPRDALARGVTGVCHIGVVSTAPFGLLLAARGAAYGVEQVVHPALVPVVPPEPGGGTEGDGPPRRTRTGLDLSVVREWRPGDDPRRVHRRASARHGRPLVVDREEPTGDRVAVVVAGPGEGLDWEPLVSLVASLAVETVAAARPVALVARQDGLAPAVGTDPRPLLDWCAALTAPAPPGTDEITAAFQHVGPGGTVLVALTAAADPGLWPALQAAAAGRVALVPLQARGVPPAVAAPARAVGL